MPILALLAGNILLVLGTGLQSVLLPVRAHLDGFSAPMLGFLGAGYYFGFVLGCLATPWLVRRAGHCRAFAALAVVAAQTFPLHAALPNIVAWVGLRAVGGFCFAGLSMIVESWVNEKCGNGNRGRMLAIYMVVTSLASAGGQSLLHLLDPQTVLAFAAVSLLISLSLVPLMLSKAAAPAPLVRAKLDIGRLYRTSPVALLGALSVGLANGAFWSLAPMVAQSHGRSPDQVANLMASAVLGGALMQGLAGRLSDRFDRRKLMLIACGGAVLTGVPLAALHDLPALAEIALAAAFGGTAFQVYGLTVAHANDHAAPGGFVETSGGLLLTFGLGAVSGPLLASAMMERLGPDALYLFIAAVYLGLAGFIAHRMTKRGPARSFIGSPAQTPADGQSGPSRWRLRWAAR